MNTQETIDLLNGLKLRGMAEAYKAITLMPASERPDVDMGTAKLAEAERLYRDNQKTQLFLKTSRLRYNANITSPRPSLPKSATAPSSAGPKTSSSPA